MLLSTRPGCTTQPTRLYLLRPFTFNIHAIENPLCWARCVLRKKARPLTRPGPRGQCYALCTRPTHANAIAQLLLVPKPYHLLPRPAWPRRQCYAPYTRCHSGAALVLASGAVHSGCYIESAAYNPSLSPFHSAVVHGVTQGMSSYGEVRTAVVHAHVRSDGWLGLSTVRFLNCASSVPFLIHSAACHVMPSLSL